MLSARATASGWALASMGSICTAPCRVRYLCCWYNTCSWSSFRHSTKTAREREREGGGEDEREEKTVQVKPQKTAERVWLKPDSSAITMNSCNHPEDAKWCSGSHAQLNWSWMGSLLFTWGLETFLIHHTSTHIQGFAM